MRIGIVGLGGIGGYFGARLAGRYTAEHELVFIQRGRHLEAVRERGLRYLTRDHQHLIHPALATDDPGEAGRFDLAILCVKSYGLEAALKRFDGCLDGKTVLLTAMNGVDIAERCRLVLSGRTVLPGCIYLSAHIVQPGVVRQVGGAGKFFFGPEEGDVEKHRWVEALLAGAGIKAVLDADIRARLWEKYLFVEPLATLTAATGLSIGQAVRDPAGRRQFIDLMREIIALAAARGVALEESLIAHNLELAQRIPPETRTSMQIDVESGRPAELDLFTEFVIRESGKSGVDAPLHRELSGIIKGKTGG
jgi:2-dehydropantoate 2-reductase